VEKGLKKFVHQYGVEKKTLKETRIQIKHEFHASLLENEFKKF
jgi:hypothetical protein